MKIYFFSLTHIQVKRFLSPLFFSFFIFSPFVFAQDLPPNFRSSEQAEIIERKVRKEAEETLQKKPKSPQIKEEEKEQATPQTELRFFLNEIHLEGNTLFSSKDLEPEIKLYQNREVTFSQLKKLCEIIEKEYRKKGFVATHVYIPPQRVEKGIVTIEIVESKVADLSVEGNHYFRKKRLLTYSKIKQGESLHYGKLRNTLYRMNENPDREVRAVLRPGKEWQTTDVIYHVRDTFPLHAGFSYDNQGRKSSGKQRFGFSVRDNNLTGFDDILLGGFVFGRNFGAVFSQYLFPIPQFRAKIIAGFTHAQVTPQGDVKPFGVNGTAQTYSIGIQQVLHDASFGSVSMSLGYNLGFEFKESRTRVLSGTFTRERLRILRVGPNLRIEDPLGITQLFNEFSVGFNGLGASIFADPAASRQGVRPDFFRYKVGLSRNQKMPWGTRALFKMEFQLPANKLSTQEEIYMGGASSVRGYPEGDYLADSGYLINFEYLVPTFFFPSAWQLPYSDLPLRKQIELVSFIDEGYGRLRGPSSRESESRHLLGVGGGLRIHLFKDFYARAEWAYALGAQPLTEQGRHQFHFRLQMEV